jgi:hypothetical protein
MLVACEAMPEADCVLMNGVFTEKRGMPFEDCKRIFSKC